MDVTCSCREIDQTRTHFLVGKPGGKVPLGRRRCRWDIILTLILKKTASMVYWSEFLATDPEVPGSILGGTGFFEKSWVLNAVHSAS
jgi:hypothetical protein